jgi:hypothetical protein
MRGPALLIKSSLVALLTLAFVSCGASRPDPDRGSLRQSEAELVEDSGKRISGEYYLQSVEDDYSAKSAQGEAQTTFSFREDGTFAIERESRGRPSGVDEGTYVISSRGELVPTSKKSAASSAPKPASRVI